MMARCAAYIQTVVLLLICGTLQQATADICEVCNCMTTSGGFTRIQCRYSTKANVHVDLDNIQWPTGNTTQLWANFNELNYNYVPKILGSATVASINLDHNIIDTISRDPFQQCRNLIEVSIVNNSIHQLPADFLKSPVHLRHLNLSKNFLSDFQSGLVAHLAELITIDLSYNELTILSIELLTALRSVKNLNLEGNQIFMVQSDAANEPSRSTITELNLSKNKLTLVTASMLGYFTDNIVSLNLSHNLITNIERESFNTLEELRLLDLSNNQLIDLQLSLPDGLQYLDLSGNKLRTWPTHNLPLELLSLNVRNNRLHELFTGQQHWQPNKLVSLDASHNEIEALPSGGQFPELLTLDLSHNAFTTAPRQLALRAPMLDTLVLDANPIKSIVFLESVSLRRLSLSHMPLLRSIDNTSFHYVDEQENCIELSISHCPKFDTITAGALQKLPICKLDLSNNALSAIPMETTDWTLITDGINLQGNPFVCNCSSQWMLDIVLKQLYDNPEHQYYLIDLKCSTPDPFSGHRFVKYLKRRGAFCNASERMLMPMNVASFADSDTSLLHLRLSHGPGFVIVVALSIITLIVMIVVGVYLTRLQREKTRKNRRYIDYDY